MDFLDYVVKKFPFRIKYNQTDNAHEFQSKFHWHVEDLGMLHRYIKPRSQNLMGKLRDHTSQIKQSSTNFAVFNICQIVLQLVCL